MIEGTDSARIAECLGLDPAKFSGGGSGGGPADSAADDVFGAALEDDEARFSDAAPLQLGCAACGEVSRARPLHAALAAPADGKHPCLACPHCGTDYDGVAMHNGLTLAMRAAERAYYTVRGGARALADLAPSAPARLRTQPVQPPCTAFIFKSAALLPLLPLQPRLPSSPPPPLHPPRRPPLQSELVCEEASCGEVSRTLSAFVSTDENGQPLFPVRAPHAAQTLFVCCFVSWCCVVAAAAALFLLLFASRPIRCAPRLPLEQRLEKALGPCPAAHCSQAEGRGPATLQPWRARGVLTLPSPLSPAQACVAPRCRARMRAQHSARQLHTQLLYSERLFDVAYAQKRAERAHRRRPAEHGPWVQLCPSDRAVCDALVAHVRSRLSDCAFNAVNLRELCSLVRGCAPMASGAGPTLAIAAPVA